MIHSIRRPKPKETYSTGVVSYYSIDKFSGKIIENNTEKEFIIFNKKFPLVLFKGDVVNFSYSNQYANNIIVLNSFQDGKQVNSLLSQKLILSNEYMAFSQMKQPHIIDERGYSVSTFSHGYKLSQIYKQTNNISAQILILEAICGLLKNHMNTQLRNSNDTKNIVPLNYQLYDSDLFSIISNIENIYKSKRHLHLIDRANYYLKNMKRISVSDYTDENQNMGIVVSSIEKTDLKALSIILSIKIVETNGISMIYCNASFKNDILLFITNNMNNVVDYTAAINFLNSL